MATRVRHGPRVSVKVTQDIIEAAVPRDSGHCMVADAVKATVPNARSVAVDLQTIRWSDPKLGRRFTYLTPRTAQVALINFDQGTRPEPFEFQLRNAQSTPLKSTKIKEHARMVRPVDAAAHSVPDRVGGRTPPIGPLAHGSASGRRRAFGIRALTL